MSVKQHRYSYAGPKLACSRLLDGGGKSFSNKKGEKRAGAGERQGGGACTHFFNGLFRLSLPFFPPPPPPFPSRARLIFALLVLIRFHYTI